MPSKKAAPKAEPKKTTKTPPPKFTIIRDTREQTPWKFNATESCNGYEDKKLDHGDYAIAGLEHLIFIERKASPSEIAQNVLEDRFGRLLLEAENYKYRYIVCEFDLDSLMNYPYGNSLPKYVVNRIKITGAFLLSKLQQYEMEHGVHVVYCGNKIAAQKFTLALLKKINGREAT